MKPIGEIKTKRGYNGFIYGTQEVTKTMAVVSLVGSTYSEQHPNELMPVEDIILTKLY